MTGSTDSPLRPLVLVVDDDVGVREALSSLLVPRLEPAFRVEAAASGEEALDIVQSAPTVPVALVITDERMPGLSGNDLLLALRQDARHRHGGRILVTAFAGLESVKRAINEAQVDKYYPKPWNSDEQLLPSVTEILSRFGERSGLDSYWVAGYAGGAEEFSEILEIRREWWMCVNLIEHNERNAESFRDESDSEALHFLARHASPRGTRPAASMRLRIAGARGTLDSLAFWPEWAGDAVETHLVRTVLVDAATRGVDIVEVDAPALRRDVYEALGFGAVGDEATSAGTVRMRISPMAGAAAPLQVRYRRDQALCGCFQTGCVSRDYARERRGYFCPLDNHRGAATPDSLR